MRHIFEEITKGTTKVKPNSIWMTYLPYISNCDGLGAHIDLHTLMSLDQKELTKASCTTVPLGEKNPIDFWLPFVP